MGIISKFIVNAIEQKKDIDLISGECCFCGKIESEKFHEKNKILSKSFTEYNYMKNKNCEFVCEYCRKLLNNNYLDSPKGKKCGLRLYSFLIENNKFEIINYDKKIYYLFDHFFKLPFLLCFTSLGKKHIFYKAKFSYSKNIFFVCTEEGNIYFERDKYKEIYKIVNRLYQLGVSKDELKNCIIDPKKINKYAVTFNDLIIIKKYKNNSCYELIINCLIKDEK